jgi:predicted nuclease with TOPRIM domain
MASNDMARSLPRSPRPSCSGKVRDELRGLFAGQDAELRTHLDELKRKLERQGFIRDRVRHSERQIRFLELENDELQGQLNDLQKHIASTARKIAEHNSIIKDWNEEAAILWTEMDRKLHAHMDKSKEVMGEVANLVQVSTSATQNFR